MHSLIKHRGIAATLGTLLLIACTSVGAQSESIITIESWRADDEALWKEKILPVFEAANPGIWVRFKPTNPSDYSSELSARLKEGRAGDIITCRPFDDGLTLYENGHLEDLESLQGMENFSDGSKAAWSTDDGDVTFCVPMASVIHGFVYNKEAFREIGLEVPKTESEFYAALDKIKNESSYVPMAFGTKDTWGTALMGFNNIGTTYWKGEEGRKALLSGEAKMTDKPYVDAFRQLARWAPYLGDDYNNQPYGDSQMLFTFGRAAIYPGGSWEISGFQEDSDFELGVFPPPKINNDTDCFISDHADMGIGMNVNTKHKEAVMKFLEWTTTAEFAGLLTNAAPGFFSLSDHDIDIENPLANEFASMRKDCKSSIRLTYHILSRGEPQMRKLLWQLSADVIDGSQTPEEAAAEAQAHLDKTYKPIMQSLNED